MATPNTYSAVIDGKNIQITVANSTVQVIYDGKKLEVVAETGKLTGEVIGTSGSYNNGGATIQKAFDGDTSTYYDGAKGNGNWLGLDLGTPKKITKIRFFPRDYANRMLNGKFEAANKADFSDAVVFYTIATNPPANKFTEAEVSTNGGYRYVRYNSPAGSFGNVVELEFYGENAGIVPVDTKVEAPVETPKPTPVPTPVPVPPVSGKKSTPLTILDGDAQSRTLAKEAGFKGFRNWLGLSWASGKPWNMDTINQSNQQASEGYIVIVTVNVAEKGTRETSTGDAKDKAPDPQFVVDALSKLDKRIIIQFGNEINLGTYWPQGDVASATKYYGAMALAMKKLGYTVAAPSLTWQSTGDLNKWMDIIIANTPKELKWDYLDGHNYTTNIKNFEEIAKFYNDRATAYGAKTMLSEWSGKTSVDNLAGMLPQYIAILNKYTDINAHFIFGDVAKFKQVWPFCHSGGKTNALFEAFKKVNV